MHTYDLNARKLSEEKLSRIRTRKKKNGRGKIVGCISHSSPKLNSTNFSHQELIGLQIRILEKEIQPEILNRIGTHIRIQPGRRKQDLKKNPFSILFTNNKFMLESCIIHGGRQLDDTLTYTQGHN
jgi:hypothetical protein